MSASTQEDLATTIEDALRHRFAERSGAAAEYGEEFTELWRLAADHVLGGKLIRPRLLLEVHRALDPECSADDAATAVELAANVELLHFAFLLHDDVIDGDLVRRHRPNLIGSLAGVRNGDAQTTERGLHWARASALLMGDLLLSTATLGFARADVSARIRERLLDLLEHVVLETVAGEHTDVGLSDGMIRPDLQTILAMTAYKTATYSFALPLRTAAILAEATPSVETSMVTVGRHLGLAYQLQDDHLSVFGDHAVHGKDAYADLRSGKETAIIAYARMTSEWSSIAPGFGRADLHLDDAARLKQLLIGCGAESFVRSLVDDQLTAAHAALEGVDGSPAIPEAARRAIIALAEGIEGRRR